MVHYQELLDHEREEQTKKAVEVQLEPIYKELEEIRKRVFALQDCHINDIHNIRDAMDDREEAMRSEAKENFKLLQDNMDLIIELSNGIKYVAIDVIEHNNFKYFLLTQLSNEETALSTEFDICRYDEVNNKIGYEEIDSFSHYNGIELEQQDCHCSTSTFNSD